MRETKSVQNTITEPKPSTSCSEERDKSDNSQTFDTATKAFDDFCFKAPLPPVKRNAVNSSKKRFSINGAKLNDRTKPEEDGGEKSSEKVSTSMEQLCLDNDASITCASASTSEVCVSIGKDSFLCPRSRQYFASEFPGLELEKPSPLTATDETPDDNDEVAAKKQTKNSLHTLLEEVIIDGFSLLLFISSDDHDVLKEHERQLKEREREEDIKRRLHESNTRSSSKSKKIRKIDAEKAIRKEKREMKEKEREERREARRMRKQQKEQLVRDRQERKDRLQQLTAEERLAEKRREKREKRESSNMNTGPSSTDVFGDVVVELNSVTLTPKSSKSREELRRIKREKKLQQVKHQLKQAAACALDENLANNSAPTLNQQSSFYNQFSAGIVQSTSAGVSSDSGNEHCAMVLNMTSAELSKEDSSINVHDSNNIGNSLSPAIMGCLSNATTSTTFNESLDALKRPSSAIGIAQQQQRGILSPLDNSMSGRNGIVPAHADLPPANKVRKLETGINDFLNAHQHLSGMTGARLSLAQNNNLLLNSEIKMENGFISKSNTSTILNNSTANSQRSTPLSKGTPLSADPAHGNSASSSTGPQLPVAIQTPSASSGSTTLLSQSSKQLPMLNGVNASMLAVIQQLLGSSVHGGANSNVAVQDDSARIAAANLLYQQNLLSQVDWFNVNQQKLPLKAPTMNSLESPANLMAAAVSLGSGFPLYNYQQQLLQYQLEQAQKRPVSNAQQCTMADTMSQQTLSKLGSGALASVASSSMLPGGFSAHLLTSGETALASNPAVVNKVSLSQMQNSAAKNNKWTERHVLLANKISRDADHRRNLVAATQQMSNSQQLAHQQQLLLQQKVLQQQQQLSMTAFMPGNSKQSASEAATSATSAVITTNSLTTGRKRSETGENTAPQYKRPNIVPAVGLTRRQQEQHRQQVIQMAALNQQAQQQHPQVLQQQQQLQMEALRRIQQQQFQKQTNAQLSIDQPTENFLSQLHLLQQQQRLQATPVMPSSSNANAQPIAIAKAMGFQQATPQQMTAHQVQPGVASLPNGLSTTASQLLSPVSFINSALFNSGAPKLIGSGNVITNEQQRQHSHTQSHQKLITPQSQQQRVLPLQPLDASLAYAAAQASASNNLLSSVSAADALSLPQHLNLQNHLQNHHQLQHQHQQLQQHQTMPTSLGFPIAPQGTASSGISGGSLTSGTSALANAALASVSDPTAQLNSLLALQQQQTGANMVQGAALNNPILAMAQLMMQQLSNSTPVSSASNNGIGPVAGLNPLLPLQSQQQTANNILTSLGIIPNSGIPSSMPSSSQPNQISQTGASQQIQHLQNSGQRVTSGVQNSIHFVGSGANTAPSSSTIAITAVPPAVSLTTTTASSASAPSANVAPQQQQQDLLLQAALLHGIQSLETKHPSIAGTPDTPQPTTAALLHHHVAATAAVSSVHQIGCGVGRQPLAGDQLQQQQQQQLLLERIAGFTNPRGLC